MFAANYFAKVYFGQSFYGYAVVPPVPPPPSGGGGVTIGGSGGGRRRRIQSLNDLFPSDDGRRTQPKPKRLRQVEVVGRQIQRDEDMMPLVKVLTAWLDRQ